MSATSARRLSSCLFALILAGAALAAVPARAAEFEGVRMPDAATVGGQPLVLNGMGLRKRLVFKVYVAGLYVANKSGDGAALLAQPGAKRIAFALKRDVGADTFAKSLNDGVKERSTPERLAALEDRLERFDAIILGVKEVKEGDQVDLDFVPGAGTTIAYNGKPMGEAIPGDDFFHAILDLFVGPRPVQEPLKAGLLGQTRSGP